MWGVVIALVRQQLKRVDVPRPHHREVSVIECGELRLPKSLHHREHCRVDEADRRVPVLVAELSDSCVVGGDERFDLVRPSGNVIEQCHDDPRVHSPENQLIYLDQYGGRYDKPLSGPLQQCSTYGEVGVVTVE